MTECYTCLCDTIVFCRGLCTNHYDSERYYNNLEYMKEKGRKYYIKNKSKINSYNNKWRKNNPDKVLKHLKKHLETNSKIFNMTSNEYMYAVNSWSKTIKSLDNYMCKSCNSMKNIMAHHLCPKSDFPELSLDLDNGVTLCKKCHTVVHNFKIY
ncbi:hypothetical protein LCGC14_1054770 [marine sediment metagenome]|uniref:HNH nuclease domain-containing protein n=1 Tax=marine sediment metagenome TaxID=412755 RepID=A0A0F9Q5V9_9ZZZZ